MLSYCVVTDLVILKNKKRSPGKGLETLPLWMEKKKKEGSSRIAANMKKKKIVLKSRFCLNSELNEFHFFLSIQIGRRLSKTHNFVSFLFFYSFLILAMSLLYSLLKRKENLQIINTGLLIPFYFFFLFIFPPSLTIADST